MTYMLGHDDAIRNYMKSIEDLDNTMFAFDLDGTLCKNPSGDFKREIAKNPSEYLSNKDFLRGAGKMLKEYLSGNDRSKQSEIFVSDILKNPDIQKKVDEYMTDDFISCSIYPGAYDTLKEIPNKIVLTKTADYIADKYKDALGLKEDEMISEVFYKEKFVPDIYNGFENVISLSDSDLEFMKKTKKQPNSTTINVLDILKHPIHPYDLSMTNNYEGFLDY